MYGNINKINTTDMNVKRNSLILVRGVSGSGKSSFTHTIMSLEGHWSYRTDDEENVYQICTDDFFYDSEGNYNFDVSKLSENHLKCQKQVGKWLSEGKNIIVHNTFTQDWELKPYQILGETFDYDVFTIIVENRHGNKNNHGVDDDGIKKQRDRFEVKL